jgi:HlyD family secretion protein
VQRRTLAALLVLASALTLGACRRGSSAAPAFAAAEVARGDVAVTASADGVVEPIRTVEVKSKASGEIIAMSIDSGDHVQAGQVLLQLRHRDP